MRVIVGRVGRPHGIRGEVVIGVRTDEPDLRFAVVPPWMPGVPRAAATLTEPVTRTAGR